MGLQSVEPNFRFLYYIRDARILHTHTLAMALHISKSSGWRLRRAYTIDRLLIPGV